MILSGTFFLSSFWYFSGFPLWTWDSYKMIVVLVENSGLQSFLRLFLWKIQYIAGKSVLLADLHIIQFRLKCWFCQIWNFHKIEGKKHPSYLHFSALLRNLCYFFNCCLYVSNFRYCPVVPEPLPSWLSRNWFVGTCSKHLKWLKPWKGWSVTCENLSSELPFS